MVLHPCPVHPIHPNIVNTDESSAEEYASSLEEDYDDEPDLLRPSNVGTEQAVL
jgi:hypothetical protein